MSVIDEKSNDNEVAILEKFYEELYSKAGILYISIEPDFVIASCNITTQEVLGHDREAICGKNFLNLFSSDCRQDIEKHVGICLNRGFIKDIEASMLCQSGDILSVKLSGMTQSDEEGIPQRVRFYIQDISEIVLARKLSELSKQFNRLHTSQDPLEKKLEKGLSTVQDCMGSEGIGLFVKNRNGQHFSCGNWKGVEKPESESADFRRWLPDAWHQFLNMCKEKELAVFTEAGSLIISSLSEMIGHLKPSDGVEHLLLLAEFESLVVVPIPSDDEMTNYLIMTHKLPEKWQVSDVELIESYAPLFPLQDEIVAQEPVPADSHQLAVIMDTSIFGILVVSDGVVQMANGWIEKVLEYSREELEGKNLQDLIASDSQSVYEEILKSGDKRKNQNNLIVETKEGKRIGVQCERLQTIIDGTPSEIWLWIHVGDRERLQEQLIQARKMESLGLLAGGIVHDFNNLLATILGFNSLLLEEISNDSPYYNDVKQIGETSEKATELTSRLLAYAQGKSYIINNLDVNQLIREIAGILSRTLDKRIAIRAELDDDLLAIRADAGQVQQAILQVALNSRDAMEFGGRIIFKTSNLVMDKGDARLSEGRQAGSYILVEISDNGEGMNGQIKEHIFEPYFTTKDKMPGKGLGLSMVHEIVEKHGGFVSVFSEKSTGTVFKMYLPATKNRVQKEKMRVPSTEKPLLGKETILLIDDEKILKDTARKMLTRYGYKVICAGSVQEAVAIYKKYMKRIDLIILDLIIPGMDVKQILGWFRRVNPKAKIIAAAGLGEREYIERNFSQSLSGFVQKPFQVRPLLNEVRNILNA